MPKLVNLARVVTATVGIGTVTLGAAVPAYLTFAQAGLSNGDQVWYSLRDSNGGSEAGVGTYSSAGPTLSRDTVLRSTGAGNTGKISLSGSAQVIVTVLAETFSAVALSGSASDLSSGTLPNARLAAVPNSALANSAVTISGHSISLGGSYALAAADVSGLAAVATSGSASDLTTGTLPNARLVSVPNSALANSAVTISGHSVSLGGSYSLVAADVSGLATVATSGSASDLSSGTLAVARGGTGATTGSAGPYLPLVGGSLTGTLNIDMASATGAIFRLHNSVTGTTSADGLELSIDNSGAAYLWNYENTALQFATNNTARMTIAASGGITTTAPLAINRTIPSGGSTGNLYLGGALSSPGHMAFNAYLNAAANAWLHLTGTGTAGVFGYDYSTNLFSWYTAPNTSAGSTTATTVLATLSNAGALNLYGSLNAFFVTDRSTTGSGGFYRTGGISRLWDSVGGDIIQYDGSTVGIKMAPNASYALAVTGSIYSSGIINATSGLYAGGYPVIGASSTYTVLTDPSGNNRIYVGNAGDPTIYLRNTTIYLQDIPGTTNFLTANVNGISTPGAVAIGAAVPGNVGLYMNTNLGGSSNYPIYLQNTGAYVFLYIRADAAIAYVGVAAWTYSSDRRVKTDIKAISPKEALANVLAFKPSSFTMIETGEKSFGLIAQDVRPICPDLINVAHATTLAPDGMLGLKYNGLHGIEIAAIQELARRVTALEGKK